MWESGHPQFSHARDRRHVNESTVQQIGVSLPQLPGKILRLGRSIVSRRGTTITGSELGPKGRSFALDGVEGTATPLAPGRPPKYDEETRHKLQTRVCQQPEDRAAGACAPWPPNSDGLVRRWLRIPDDLDARDVHADASSDQRRRKHAATRKKAPPVSPPRMVLFQLRIGARLSVPDQSCRMHQPKNRKCIQRREVGEFRRRSRDSLCRRSNRPSLHRLRRDVGP